LRSSDFAAEDLGASGSGVVDGADVDPSTLFSEDLLLEVEKGAVV
jgi:hypothetical protein